MAEGTNANGQGTGGRKGGASSERSFTIQDTLGDPDQKPVDVAQYRMLQDVPRVVPLGSVNFKQMPDYLEEANNYKVLWLHTDESLGSGLLVRSRIVRATAYAMKVCSFTPNRLNGIKHRLDL